MPWTAAESTNAANSLAGMFIICSNSPMSRIDEQSVANALLQAPGWARVGLSAPSAWVREEAARELALAVIEGRECTPLAYGQELLPL